MSEAPEMKMQLVDNDGSILIDIEPPLTGRQQSLIRRGPGLRDIPDTALVFRNRAPDEGEPFTEIDCGVIWDAVKSEHLELNERCFAQNIAHILRENGAEVSLDDRVIPLEESGYKFLAMTSARPE